MRLVTLAMAVVAAATAVLMDHRQGVPASGRPSEPPSTVVTFE
jgi:hypothetical protein